MSIKILKEKIAHAEKNHLGGHRLSLREMRDIVAELEVDRDALAAENATLIEAIKTHQRSTHFCGVCGNDDPCSTDDVCYALNGTPVTDAVIAALRGEQQHVGKFAGWGLYKAETDTYGGWLSHRPRDDNDGAIKDHGYVNVKLFVGPIATPVDVTELMRAVLGPPNITEAREAVAKVLARYGISVAGIDDIVARRKKEFVEDRFAQLEQFKTDVLRCVDDAMRGCNSLTAPEYAVRVAAWLNDDEWSTDTDPRGE